MYGADKVETRPASPVHSSVLELSVPGKRENDQTRVRTHETLFPGCECNAAMARSVCVCVLQEHLPYSAAVHCRSRSHAPFHRPIDRSTSGPTTDPPRLVFRESAHKYVIDTVLYTHGIFQSIYYRFVMFECTDEGKLFPVPKSH